MKFLSICDPSRYGRPPLDVPTFYQGLALDSRVDAFHIPTQNVFEPDTNSDKVRVATVEGDLPYETFLELGSKAHKYYSLDDVDLVFCRTLKPFSEGYLDRLRSWEKYTKFVNSPTGKKEQIQSRFLQQVAGEFIPEAIVTSSEVEAGSFFEKHQIIVAKLDNSCGGRGVFKIWYEHGVFQVDNLLLGSRQFECFPQVMSYLQGLTSETFTIHAISEARR